MTAIFIVALGYDLWHYLLGHLEVTEYIYNSPEQKIGKQYGYYNIQSNSMSIFVDPVHLFLSLSLETVFRQKPPPITVLAVADMNTNVCKLVACTKATTHRHCSSGLQEEKPKEITFYHFISY